MYPVEEPRCADRMKSGPYEYDPPRRGRGCARETIRVASSESTVTPASEPAGYGFERSCPHSHTLPYMSNSPRSFGLSWPTGHGRSLNVVPVYQAYSRSSSSLEPKKRLTVLPARQANSHSASVGRR